MKKYLNPEYVNVSLMSEDVITASIIEIVGEDANLGYTMHEEKTYNSDGTTTSKGVVKADISSILGGMTFGL